MERIKNAYLSGVPPLCPLCGRELPEDGYKEGSGWQCRCGEFVPESLAVTAFEGCTHGLNCNCGRERKK